MATTPRLPTFNPVKETIEDFYKRVNAMTDPVEILREFVRNDWNISVQTEKGKLVLEALMLKSQFYLRDHGIEDNTPL